MFTPGPTYHGMSGFEPRAVVLHSDCHGCGYPRVQVILPRSSREYSLLRPIYFYQARSLEHTRPLPTSTRVAVLEMLPKMVRPVELLDRVALAEPMHLLEVAQALLPVSIRRVPRASPVAGVAASEVLAAVSARVRLARTACALVERLLVAAT
jgi:hypothetical protein